MRPSWQRLSDSVWPSWSVGNRLAHWCADSRLMPKVRDGVLGCAVVPGILRNGIIHMVNHLTEDMTVVVRLLPMVGSVRDGKRLGIFQGVRQR